jgi:hypothetical protein
MTGHTEYPPAVAYYVAVRPTSPNDLDFDIRQLKQMVNRPVHATSGSEKSSSLTLQAVNIDHLHTGLVKY